MTGVAAGGIVTMGCEGGCGCRLAPLGIGDHPNHPWESTERQDDGGRATPYRVAVAEHTAMRCRAIRALREAAQRAAPHLTVIVQVDYIDTLHIIGYDDRRWIEVGWSAQVASDLELSCAVTYTANHFATARGLTGDLPRWPVLARDPLNGSVGA